MEFLNAGYYFTLNLLWHTFINCINKNIIQYFYAMNRNSITQKKSNLTEIKSNTLRIGDNETQIKCTKEVRKKQNEECLKANLLFKAW